MTGAILRREIVVPARKLHTFLVRGGYSLVLAATFGIIFLIHLIRVADSGQAAVSVRMVTQSGEWLFHSLVTINILVCLLFTPAYVASAISQEKDQRTMQDLLLTTMSAVEIVFSKLVGRLGQVALVLAAGLPLVSIGSLLGSVSGSMQLALVAMTVLWLVTAGSFTLLISVLVRRTRDAILGTYALGTLLLVGISIARFAMPIPAPLIQDILDAFYPFTIISFATAGASPLAVWQLIAETALVLGTFSAGALLLAVLLLRPLGVRQLEVKATRGRWRMKRRVVRSPDERPMLWKEQCFPASGKVTWSLHLLGFIAAATIGATLVLWVGFWFTNGRQGSALFEAAIWFFVVKLLTWLVCLSMLLTSSSAFAGERERMTWDAVLTSPLESREIVWGKLAGCVWDVRWWLAAIGLCFLQIVFQAVAAPETYYDVWGSSSAPVVWRIARIAGLVVTGSFGGMPGIIGIAGDFAFLLGLGLRTSLGSKTSGKALAVSLMIWIGSMIVVGIGLSLCVAVIGLAVFVVGRGDLPSWLNVLLQFLGSQLMWLGPLLIGLFWGAVGVWLIRRTIVRFDELASRMDTREVLRLEGLGAESRLSAPIPLRLLDDTPS